MNNQCDQLMITDKVCLLKVDGDILIWDSGILFSLKKEEGSHPCYNMDIPWRHYDEWNKSDTKGQIWYDYTYRR